MDERTKIKLENTVEQAGALVGLTALSLVASAIGPIFETKKVIKELKNTKRKKGEITVADLREAMMSYATDFLPTQRRIIHGASKEFDDVVKAGKKRLADYDKKMEDAARQLAAKQADAAANTPEELEKSGVATVLTVIDKAHEVIVFDSCVMDEELNRLIRSNKEHEVIIKVGNIYISAKQHTVYMKMSDDSVKTLVFPPKQYSSIATHARDRIRELRNAKREAIVADFTAAVNAQMTQSTK